MFESVRQTMSGHKPVVFAAVAVAAMLAFAMPAQSAIATIADPLAELEIDLFDTDQEQDFAQRLVDETTQEIDQEQEAEQEQEQEQDARNTADQRNTATVRQDETNDQSNVLVTGDNTASTTQSGSNTANENSATAASEGGDGGCCDGDKKPSKHKKSDPRGGSGGDSKATASVGIDQNVRNDAVTVQDSSADGNTLSNTNTFGDDIAVVDQDNVADQRAINVGLQDQDLDQDQDATQEDLNFQYGFAQQSDEDALTVDISILEEVLGGGIPPVG